MELVLQFFCALAFGFALTKLILLSAEFKPKRGMKVRIRTPRGVVRSSFLAEMEDAWTFGPCLGRAEHALPQVGDEVVVEFTLPKGRAFFRSKITAIDPEPAYRILMNVPGKVFKRDRRHSERHQADGKAIQCEGSVACLVDISEGGARITLDEPQLTKGTEITLRKDDQSVRALVVGTLEDSQLRLMFTEAADKDWLKSLAKS